MLRYVPIALLMYICLEKRENEAGEKITTTCQKKKKEKERKKRQKERKVVRHSATFPLTNIGLFFLLSAAQIPQRGSKYD